MSFRTPVLLLLLLFAAATSMSATIYYVSPSGNDFFLGTSQLLPWATVAKVNQANLRSGDQVLFLRGGTWRETLVPQTSGLCYGAYGTGDRPILSGAGQLSVGWLLIQPNVWAYNLGSVAPTQVWFNGVLGTQTTAVQVPQQWSYAQGWLYVYSTSMPGLQILGNGMTIEATQRSTALSVANVSTLNVSNLAFVNTSGASVSFGSGNTGQQIFYNDIFSGSSGQGFAAASGEPYITGSEILNNGTGLSVTGGPGFIVNDSILSGNFNRAIFVSGTTGPSYIVGSTITGNSTHNPASETVTNFGSYGLNMSNSVLLPNPFEPKIFKYTGLTDAGNNVYQSAFFQKRAAPLIVVPFVDDYINLGVAQAVTQLANAYGCKLSYALNTKLLTTAAWQSVAQMQAAGVEVVAHTRSHSDLANNNVFAIQYTGSAATATMVINQTANRLQTFLNGSTTPDLNLDLSNTYNGVIDVLGLIPAGSHYAVTIQPNQNFFTPINLAAVSTTNIKSAPFMVQANANYLTWEVEGAQSDIAANLPGYHAKAFATPFTSSNLIVENHIQNAGFVSNRNGLLNADSTPDGNWLFTNLDVYNMAAEWLPFAFDATKATSSADALVDGLGAAGGVMAVYSHGYDEFSLQDWANFFANLKIAGATCMTMSQANAYVEAQGQLVPDGTRKNWVQTVPLTPNFTVTNISPSQGARDLQ